MSNTQVTRSYTVIIDVTYDVEDPDDFERLDELEDKFDNAFVGEIVNHGVDEVSYVSIDNIQWIMQ